MENEGKEVLEMHEHKLHTTCAVNKTCGCSQSHSLYMDRSIKVSKRNQLQRAKELALDWARTSL